MPVRVRTSTGMLLVLGARVDNGREGVVYRVEGAPALLGKLLPRAQNRAEVSRRLTALVRHGRSPRAVRLLAGTPRRAAWPVGVIHSVARGIPGFLMPDMAANFKPMDSLISAAFRTTCFPAATWATSLAAAINLAQLVADVHEAGYVIGDLKQENLWAGQDGTVGISDVDSFQFTDGGEFFPCRAMSPGYTAPEGIDNSAAVLDAASDNFVLAVLIYQLLMDGMHPFHGQPGDGTPYVSLDDNVLHGRARIVQADLVRVPSWVPPLTILPRHIRALFRQCFGARGCRIREARPAASEWVAALAQVRAAGQLQSCQKVAEHVFTRERPWCPWCDR